MHSSIHHSWGVFALNKKVIYTLSTAFLLSGLTACNTNTTDEGALGNNANGARPIGYYSDENANRTNGGNAFLLDGDNDGPVTEILDRTANDGTNGRTNDIATRDRNARTIGTRDNGLFENTRIGTTRNVGFNNRDNQAGLTRPNAVNNSLQRNNRFNGNDFNYHGQMASRNNNARASYFNNYNGRLAEQIANRVQDVTNVDDVRTIVRGDDILVAIDTNDRNNRNVEQEVRNAIRTMTAGKDVRIVTDENFYTRARNIDNDLRNGGPTEDLDADVRDMFREIGDEFEDAIETPFRDTK